MRMPLDYNLTLQNKKLKLLKGHLDSMAKHTKPLRRTGNYILLVVGAEAVTNRRTSIKLRD